MEERRRKEGSKSSIGHYWSTPSNIRRFFDTFAKKKGFDPLKARDWYSYKQEDVVMEKVSNFISLSLPILSMFAFLFPSSLPFASPSILLPSIPLIHFFPVSPNIILQNGASILYHFNHSFPRALSAVYPEIYFDAKLFGRTRMIREKGGEKREGECRAYRLLTILNLDGWTLPASKKRSITSYWSSLSNRKRFLDKFAEKRGFDSIIPSNWKEIKQEDLLAELVCTEGRRERRDRTTRQGEKI